MHTASARSSASASSDRPNVSLTRYARLSVATALATILLKTGAYLLTGSVGLLSDAVESIVNLAGAALALVMLSIAARPADQRHPFGHAKAEYFSSGFEGLLIIFAAGAILWAALGRLLHPAPLDRLGAGVLVSLLASVLNLVTARILLAAGRRHGSITLEADGRHLMTDVWTSAGVVLGIACVWLTGLHWLDALIALALGLNIIWTGIDILKRSCDGLMDACLPEAEMRLIAEAMRPFEDQGIAFHALQARRAGTDRFVSVHMLFPGNWTVRRAHDLATAFEQTVRLRLTDCAITTHLEALEDARSFNHEHEAGTEAP